MSGADPSIPPGVGAGADLGSDPASGHARPHRSAVIAGIVGVVVLALVVVFAITPAGGPKKVRSPIIGLVAPQLSGVDLKGDKVDLDSFRGEWVLVNFFATWCPPCKQEHPELLRLSKDDGGPLQIVSVGFQDSTDNVRGFFADNGGSWPVLTGDTGGTGVRYGVVKLPESFLISPFGRVVAKFEGGITASQVRSYIQQNVGTGSSTEGSDTSGGS